jgi:hypothetical protein
VKSVRFVLDRSEYGVALSTAKAAGTILNLERPVDHAAPLLFFNLVFLGGIVNMIHERQQLRSSSSLSHLINIGRTSNSCVNRGLHLRGTTHKCANSQHKAAQVGFELMIVEGTVGAWLQWQSPTRMALRAPPGWRSELHQDGAQSPTRMALCSADHQRTDGTSKHANKQQRHRR